MKHPDYNSEDKPWAESTKGKAYFSEEIEMFIGYNSP
jgi:hypothetical protein